MDRTAEFRSIIKRVIQEYAEFFPKQENLETQIVFDEEHDHYFLYYTGWQGKRRVHGTPLHIDIIEGKIWIQHDGTEDGIADELLEAGISKEEIVLAFYPQVHRKYTEFAVA